MSYNSTPNEDFGCAFIVLIVVGLVSALGYLVYVDISNPQFSQVVCSTQNVETFRSSKHPRDRIYKKYESADYYISGRYYTPKSGELCDIVTSPRNTNK